MNMERQLAHSSNMDAFIDGLALPAAILRSDGALRSVNAAWTIWAQDTFARAPIRAITTIVDSDHRARLQSYLQSSAKNAASFTTTAATYQLELLPVHARAPSASGLLCFANPRNLAQGDRKDFERWHHLIEAHDQGMWDLNHATGERYFSKNWATLRGLDPDDTRHGKPAAWLSRIHPNDQASVKQHRNAIAQNSTDTIFFEYRERHAEGHWIWIMSRGTVVDRDEKGAVTRIVGIDTDISHLKIGADQDEEISKRLQIVVSASDFGIWEFDTVKNRVTWDQKTRDIYGLECDRKDWPSEIWGQFLHPDDSARIFAQTEIALRDGHDYDLRFRINRPDGAVRHLRSRATHVTNMQGQTNILGITWDVTAEAEQAAEIAAAHATIQQHNAALEQARAEMEHRSYHDALTGLVNRRGLDKFQRDLAARDFGDQRCAVLQIDMDRFKTINDTLGHGAGDAVLKRVADILSEAAPADSIVARVGGDEFAVLIAGVSHDAVVGHWAHSLLKRAKEPFSYEGNLCRFGISIGIAIGPSDAVSSQKLFSYADLALYEAKAAGRGVVRFFTEALKVAAFQKRQRNDDILSAIENEEFHCYYQPQYDREGIKITGIEALARWKHAKHGILTPNQFLAAAEDLGVIAKLDALILQRALADAKAWLAAGKDVPTLSVNVSGKRLLDPCLSDQIAHLSQSPVPLCFELLETVFLDAQHPQLVKNLANIKDLGISLDIDDFGSGHASIVGLLNLHPDRIKIDRQLILPTTQSQQGRDLVKSIIAIARVMGVSVVAEGVETQDHVHTLQTLGCDYLQGHGLCHPVPPSQLAHLLKPR